MKILDLLETPMTPNFLRFKGRTDYCFPIWELTEKEIRAIFKRMADKVIARKNGAGESEGKTGQQITNKG